MGRDQAITTLNNLIETLKDGEEGFRTAAEGLKDAQVKAQFLEFSRQRGEMVRQLQEEVRRIGGDPEKSGSVSGTMHRGWMNIRSLVSGNDDRAIIAEAERGEDVAKQVFADALGADLPPSTMSLVQQQAAQVRSVHDKVRDLELAIR